jgi:hypothetical protein
MALTLVGSPAARAGTGELTSEDRVLLATYARDTWRSIEAMTPPGKLPFDALRRREGETWVASGLTSPSNIAAYLWSTVAAADLGLISPEEAGRRIAPTLAMLDRLERSHGFYYNWYDPETGSRARTWPGGGVLRPFLSSVDNGWLAAALMLVANVRPELRPVADALLDPMDFSFFYNPFDPAKPEAHPGLLRGGFWPEEQSFTEFHYGTLNTEPRIASYIGMARGHLPAEHYYRMSRAAIGSGAGSSPRTYHVVPVVQGSLDYRGLRLVPSWDGTMFEALMVSLFVPEARWAPRSWGINHPLYVRAQIEHGMKEARLGYWGISASSDPDGGYHAFGVAGIGAWSSRNHVVGNGRGSVVTPHASFLALRYAPEEAMANLKGMTANFPVYSQYGFLDAVDVVSGRVSDCVLVLDQGMILAAIANALQDDALQRGFSEGPVENAVRPVIAAEQFDAGIDPASRAAFDDAEAETTVLATLAVPVSSRVDVGEQPAVPAPHVPLAAPRETALDQPTPRPSRPSNRRPRRRTRSDGSP